MPADPNIIDVLGVSWTLKVQELAVLFYDHPSFGMLRYDGVEAWLCDNVNTMELTSQGSLPDGVLPKRMCIRPKHDGECGCYDLNHYNPPEDKCKCCDPECPIPGFLYFFCTDEGGSCEETCQGGLTIGGGNGLDGVNNPTGPTYGMCCTLCEVEVCGNLYCSGGQWYVDIYNDGVFCNTYPIEHTCCPLQFLPITIDNCAVGCCLGFGGQADCDSGGGDCCDTAPGTLTMSFTSTCAAINADLGPSVTLTQTGPGEWTGIWYEGQEAVLTCDGAGTWSLYLPILDCSSSTKTATSVTCSPFELTFDDFVVTYDGGSCACVVGDTITVSITA